MLVKIFVLLSLLSTNYPYFSQSLLYLCNAQSSDRASVLRFFVVIYTGLHHQYVDFEFYAIENTKMPLCLHFFTIIL